MASVNKVILVGNLGTDPEIRNLENGAKLARLSIATSESYTNKEGARIEQTEWHRVIVWRGLADVAEKYLVKGKQVYVEGKLQTRQWKDSDGIDRYSTEIVGDNMVMLGRSGNTGDDSTIKNASAPKNPAVGENIQKSATAVKEDDLPF